MLKPFRHDVEPFLFPQFDEYRVVLSLVVTSTTNNLLLRLSKQNSLPQLASVSYLYKHISTYMLELRRVRTLDISKRFMRFKDTIRDQRVQLHKPSVISPLTYGQSTYTSEISLLTQTLEISTTKDNSPKLLANDFIKPIRRRKR